MNWIKNNKLSSFLILLFILLFGKNLISSFFGINMMSLGVPSVSKSGYSELSMAPGSYSDSVSYGSAGSVSNSYRTAEYAPTAQTNRLVVQETSLSFVVLKVLETVDKIIDRAKADGGYMVNSTLSQPQEAPFATVVIRVPSDKFKETFAYLRSLSVKVTSENIRGTDVTDQYVDIQAHLDTYEKTKTKFESILSQATQVQDILTVQRELINLQNQIDALKGQQKYLEQTASLAKVTIYLSSDEMSLPYAPSDTFRPNVIFKQAVRSLVSTLRGIAGFTIWAIVFGVIWVPVLVLIILIKKFRNRSRLQNK